MGGYGGGFNTPADVLGPIHSAPVLKRIRPATRENG
jgi:hypothetical protein